MSFAFNVVRFNNTLVAGVQAPTFERREEFLEAGNDAQMHLTTSVVSRAAPKASWSMLAIRALATLLGTGDEVPYVAMDGTNGLELIGAKRNTDGVGYLTGTVHPRRRGVAGILALAGVSWARRQAAVARVDAYWQAVAGGATDPITADLTTLPTLSLNTEQLGLTSFLVGATDLTVKIASFDIAVDHRVENNVDPTSFTAAQPFPTQVVGPGVNGRSRVAVTFETEELDTAVANGAIVIQLKVYTHLGVGFGATGVTLTLNSPIVREVALAGEDGSTGKRRFQAIGTFDGTNRPLTIVTF